MVLVYLLVALILSPRETYAYLVMYNGLLPTYLGDKISL